MLTTKPYLRIRRPSPTAAEFTVLTLPPPTLPLRIALYAMNALRVVLGLGVLLLLFSAWHLSPYATPLVEHMSTPTPGDAKLLSSSYFLPKAHFRHLAYEIQHSALGRLSTRAAAASPTWALVPLCAAALWALLLRVHAEERLLVLRGLGIQTSSSKATVLGRAATRFIPTEKIRDVLINEAFRGFEVRHYLVVVVEGEEDVVVVFPKLLPRPRVIEKVWRGVRECLYEQKRGVQGQGRGRGRRGDGRV